MKKKKYNYNNRNRINIIQSVPATPIKYLSGFAPLNLLEQKENFLRHGILPKFDFKCSAEKIEQLTNSQTSEIKFDLLPEAKRILDLTKAKFGFVDNYIEESFGPRINFLEASAYLSKYLSDHNVDGSMKILWSPDLNCSAQMMWHGPGFKYNKPEARKYTLCVKKSTENGFLREEGIKALADHEIGTHFFRMLNDGLQPWYSDRARFNLAPSHSREMLCTEEGLACLNTMLQAKCKLLSLSALLYYTACMASKMSFRALFEHLKLYVRDPEQRCKHVMRVKRGTKDPQKPGGYGKDQCYFEGAVHILRNIDSVDFHVLMCGKITLDEVSRVRRVARQDCAKMPHFLQDEEHYKQQLKHIANVNGLANYPKPRRKSLVKRPKSNNCSNSVATTGCDTDNRNPKTKFTVTEKNSEGKTRKTCWIKDSHGKKKLLSRGQVKTNRMKQVEPIDRVAVQDLCNEAEEDVRAKFGTLSRLRQTNCATSTTADSGLSSLKGEEIVTKFGILRRFKGSIPSTSLSSGDAVDEAS